VRSCTGSLTNDIQKELMSAKLKIAALETMIDLAEEQFKINIQKEVWCQIVTKRKSLFNWYLK